MITLPIWLLVIIGIFGLPLIGIVLALSIEVIKVAKIIIKEIIKEMW